MPSSQGNFFDKAQPEYLFNQFFGLEIEMPLVKERMKQFFIKAPIMMIMLVFMRFFIFEIFPPILGLILTLIMYYVVVFMLITYIKLLNKMTSANGMGGLLLGLLILILMVLVL